MKPEETIEIARAIVGLTEAKIPAAFVQEISELARISNDAKKALIAWNAASPEERCDLARDYVALVAESKGNFQRTIADIRETFRIMGSNEFCLGFCERFVSEGARTYTETVPVDSHGKCTKCSKPRYKHVKTSPANVEDKIRK